MPDSERRTAKSTNRRTSPNLQLVSSAYGSINSAAPDTRYIAEAGATEGFGWKLFTAFGPAGDALHASERTIRTTPLSTQVSETTIPHNHSPLTRTRHWIRDRYRTWKRGRLMREMMVCYREMPNWLLRDIGMERNQIGYTVPNERSSDSQLPCRQAATHGMP